MAASNSLNMDTSGVQTYNATTGGLDGSTTTQYIVQCGDSNNKLQGVSGIGASGEVLTSNGAGTLPTFQTLINSSTITLTKYTSSDTWTKGADTKFVAVAIWNSGSGGGSGRRATSTTSGGGGGGRGGGGKYYEMLASQFQATESVTIAGTAAGGVAQTADNTSGNAGTPSNTSYFSYIGTGTSSSAATGGATVTAPGSTATSFDFFNPFITSISTGNVSAGGSGKNTAGLASADITDDNWFMATGAGGGGGADSVTERAGAKGGDIIIRGITINTGGAGGVESGTINGGAGNNYVITGGFPFSGTGGGGGGGQKSGGAAGNGGNGGTPGGGGGGGGGSLNGTNSGAGGIGGRGEVWIWEYS